MAQLSIQEAALRAGISRQTLFRHVKQGKVSATLNSNGKLQVDTAELVRVYGELHSQAGTDTTSRNALRVTRSATDTTSLQIENERLKAQLEAKASLLLVALERVEEQRQRAEEARSDRERLLIMLEQQSRLLAAPGAIQKRKKRD